MGYVDQWTRVYYLYGIPTETWLWLFVGMMFGSCLMALLDRGE